MPTTPTSMVNRMMGAEAWTDPIALPAGSTINGQDPVGSTGQIVTLSTTPISITEATHNNRVMYVTKLDGIAITLPVPVPGMKFTFIISGTVTSASTIKSVAGTHLMMGYALMGNDSDNTVVCFRANVASTFDTINLLGTSNSTGGLEGQIIRITALTTTLWYVEIVGDAAGTEATPFQDTVT